jgi:phage terminase large subunit-like protein
MIIELKNSPPGLELKASAVPAGAAEAELVFTRAAAAKPPDRIVLVAKTISDGREVQVESTPVDVKVDSR